jgi:hypothetical protein
MSHSTKGLKRKRKIKAVPVLGAVGAAGLSLSLAGGASASTDGAALNTPSTIKNITPSHEIILGEEEISDVSLGTFYVFDKENTVEPSIRLARGCGGCHGCGGCRGCGRGCGGCRGCRGCGCGGCGGCGWGWGYGCYGGCCLSWGGCRVC